MPTPCSASSCSEIVSRSSATGKKNTKTGNAVKSKISAARLSAFKILQKVFEGQSLTKAKQDDFEKLSDDRERGLANEIINGVLRWRWQLEFYVTMMVSKPLKQKDSAVQIVLLMALYELTECRTPDYAIINQAVELVRKTGKKWAASLVNALLRRFTREREKLQSSITDDCARFSHPEWIIQKIKSDWSQDWQTILQANNQRPPFWLRVNRLHHTAEQYQKILEAEDIGCERSKLTSQAVRLEQGTDVKRLPGYSDGAFSVQDVGAQLTAELLSVSEGQVVLDMCAAPGGKTGHILESCPSIAHLDVVELDAGRMRRVAENLHRLGFIDDSGHADNIEMIVADAGDHESWWQGQLYDRILIDAPCSASGVIRRHPDIKSLRHAADIPPLVAIQAKILGSAWHMLKPGGEMLYVTCSLFSEENVVQMNNFLLARQDATEITIDSGWGVACEHGRQLLPGQDDADGFYFCRIRKNPADKQSYSA